MEKTPPFNHYAFLNEDKTKAEKLPWCFPTLPAELNHTSACLLAEGIPFINRAWDPDCCGNLEEPPGRAHSRQHPGVHRFPPEPHLPLLGLQWDPSSSSAPAWPHFTPQGNPGLGAATVTAQAWEKGSCHPPRVQVEAAAGATVPFLGSTSSAKESPEHPAQ